MLKYTSRFTEPPITESNQNEKCFVRVKTKFFANSDTVADIASDYTLGMSAWEYKRLVLLRLSWYDIMQMN